MTGVQLCKEALSHHDAERPHSQPGKAFLGQGCNAAPWHTPVSLAGRPLALRLSPASALGGEQSPLCPQRCSRVGIVAPCHAPAPCRAARELLGAGLEQGFHLCRNSFTSPPLAAGWVA